MRTARSSSRPGGSPPAPPGADTSLPDQTPWEQTPPGSRYPPPRADTPWEQTPPRADTPKEQTPPLLTESQTPMKILPCPNFVAGGKN